MNTKQSVKLKIMLVAFCVLIVCIVTSFVSVTHSIFGDVASGTSGDIVVATLGLDINSSLNNLGTLEPSKTYQGDNYKTTITNSGDSGDIFIKVKFENTLDGTSGDKLAVIFDQTKWAVGGENNNEYYYLDVLSVNSTVTFNTGFKTSNTYTNTDAGTEVTVKFTVSAIQAQYRAVEADDPNWWNDNTPASFKTVYNNYNTLKGF